VIVYIISYNLLTPLMKLVKDAETLDGVTEVVVVDNASTYAPLLSWYRESGVRVIHRPENQGPTRSFDVMDMSDWCVVTDSDLDIGDVPKDVCYELRDVMERHESLKKAGLSLDTSDIPDTTLGQKMLKWESSFWKEKFVSGFWNADIATTFAMYRPKSSWCGYRPAVRADRPYTARHVPWTWDLDNLTEEQKYYLNQSIEGTWWTIQMKHQTKRESRRTE